MTDYPQLRTERLLLRPWRPEDRAPFAAMNADERVMQHFPSVMSPQESDAMYDRIQNHFRERGFGLWAVEVVDTAAFAGFVGLTTPRFEAHFTPCVEIGWRLDARYWSRGYATEAAKASLAFGFESLQLDEIVSTTVPANTRSWRVMEKLGMQRDTRDDFEHPLIPEGHPLRQHMLYRLPRSRYRAIRIG